MPNPETWESESQEEPQRLISMEESDGPGWAGRVWRARVPAGTRHCCVGAQPPAGVKSKSTFHAVLSSASS